MFTLPYTRRTYLSGKPIPTLKDELTLAIRAVPLPRSGAENPFMDRRGAYDVENSDDALWMVDHPDSRLRSSPCRVSLCIRFAQKGGQTEADVSAHVSSAILLIYAVIAAAFVFLSVRFSQPFLFIVSFLVFADLFAITTAGTYWTAYQMRQVLEQVLREK